MFSIDHESKYRVNQSLKMLKSVLLIYFIYDYVKVYFINHFQVLFFNLKTYLVSKTMVNRIKITRLSIYFCLRMQHLVFLPSPFGLEVYFSTKGCPHIASTYFLFFQDFLVYVNFSSILNLF